MYHLLGTDLPVFLDVPKAQGTDCRCDGLSESEIRVLEEAEGELVILADRHQGTCRV